MTDSAAGAEKRTVVVTGACGYIASLMLPQLRERYELVLLDVVKPRDARPSSTVANDATAGLEVHIADLSDPNLDNYRHHFTGAHAVVHLGFGGAMGTQASLTGPKWDSEYRNIAMAHNVYQVALEEGVQRVVMASSNHAADFYEPLIHSGEFDHVRPDTYSAGARPLADNLYGWAKESYEHLGFLYAVGKETLRPLEVVQIRIGAPQERTLATVTTLQAMNRYLGAYLSARDCAQIFIKSIEAVDIHDEYGVPFQVFYGISGNYNRFWSISNAKRVIGYEPEDNALVKFGDQVATLMKTLQQEENRAKL